MALVAGILALKVDEESKTMMVVAEFEGVRIIMPLATVVNVASTGIEMVKKGYREITAAELLTGKKPETTGN